jgi:hypothetical protein
MLFLSKAKEEILAVIYFGGLSLSVSISLLLLLLLMIKY